MVKAIITPAIVRAVFERQDETELGWLMEAAYTNIPRVLGLTWPSVRRKQHHWWGVYWLARGLCAKDSFPARQAFKEGLRHLSEVHA